jgi:FAD/FMN-containing dehydrogenase
METTTVSTQSRLDKATADRIVAALAAKPREIFGANLERLREIKTVYDPRNAFNKSYALITPN